MIENWRQIFIVVLIVMSIIDLSATYYYIKKYKSWQPNKPYKLMENNPLLVFLWNMFGIHLGIFIGAVIILALIYVIGKTAHPIVVGILFIILCFTLFNHYHNINLLWKLIEKYPSGHLPVEIFGEVIGNNLK